MSDPQLSTAVALIIFNRPDTTARVFEAIRRARPSKLLVAADGPRADHAEDEKTCAAARAIIERVDWPCEVLKRYSDTNQGCKMGPVNAINWIFEHVEEAIILEDDCVPHPDYFRFCEAMLDRYRHDNRIMMVCGTNYLQDVPELGDSYFFSNYYPIWGWATWRRAWKLFDADIKAWDAFRDKRQLEWLFSHRIIARYYESMFSLARKGRDFWDIQWWFACIMQHGLAVVPRVNLITNVGDEGTHARTQRGVYTGMATYPLDTEHIRHPEYVTPDIDLNRRLYEHSHASLDLSVRTAWSRQRYRSLLRMLLPDFLVRALENRKAVK